VSQKKKRSSSSSSDVMKKIAFKKGRSVGLKHKEDETLNPK